MARVAKPKTTLRRQAWLAAGGLFGVWLLAMILAAAGLWMAWQHRPAGLWLGVFSLALLAVVSALLDRSLIPVGGYLGERRVCRELTRLPDRVLDSE